MKKPLNIRKNEIMSASLMHKKAFEFFEKTLKLNHDKGLESFLIKIPEYVNGVNVIKMLHSELQSDKFIELYTVENKKFKPIGKNRELFLWSYHKHLEEYETITSEEMTRYYLIPVNELTEVSTFIDECLEEDEDDFDLGNSKVSMKEEQNQTPNLFIHQTAEKVSTAATVGANVHKKIENVLSKPSQDLFLMHLTARDLFSIIHAKPVSNKAWINELVTNNK